MSNATLLKLPPWQVQDVDGSVILTRRPKWDGTLPSPSGRFTMPVMHHLGTIRRFGGRDPSDGSLDGSLLCQEPTLYWGKPSTLLRLPGAVILTGATYASMYPLVLALIGPLLQASRVLIAAVPNGSAADFLLLGQPNTGNATDTNPGFGSYNYRLVDPTSFVGGRVLVLTDEENKDYITEIGAGVTAGTMTLNQQRVGHNLNTLQGAIPSYRAFRLRWYRQQTYTDSFGGDVTAAIDTLYAGLGGQLNGAGLDFSYGGALLTLGARAAEYVAQIKAFFNL
jgi:hypothetical protein